MSAGSDHSTPEPNMAAIRLLRRWAVEDAAMTDAESAENEAILRAIDEDRLSDRKLFAHLWESPDRRP